METKAKTKNLVEKLFEVGAHYGYSRSRRHPSMKSFIFGTKSSSEIFDLEKTSVELEKALEFVSLLGKEGKKILFVSSKREAQSAIIESAQALGQPYVAGRWIGGTLTNFEEIRQRVERLEELREQKEKGELAKYTKHEQMLLDREMEGLAFTFGGLLTMDKLPGAMFVVDPKQERYAVREARHRGIPVVGIANSDCNLKEMTYPIPGNDTNIASINFFLNAVVESYKKSKK